MGSYENASNIYSEYVFHYTQWIYLIYLVINIAKIWMQQLG